MSLVVLWVAFLSLGLESSASGRKDQATQEGIGRRGRKVLGDQLVPLVAEGRNSVGLS